MTSNVERAEILTRALDAGIRGDFAALEGLYTDDIKVWGAAISASSAAELLTVLQRRDEAFTDVDVHITPLDVGGDYASAEWSVSMTHSGDLHVRDEVLAATGLRITVNGVSVAEFEGSRICALRQYWDELTLYEQLGLLHAGDE